MKQQHNFDLDVAILKLHTANSHDELAATVVEAIAENAGNTDDVMTIVLQADMRRATLERILTDAAYADQCEEEYVNAQDMQFEQY